MREDYQSGDNVWNFPVNQKAFDAKMKEAMTEEYQTDENGNQILDENGDPIKIPKTTYCTAAASSTTLDSDDSGRVDIYALSQEQADQILDVISKTTRPFRLRRVHHGHRQRRGRTLLRRSGDRGETASAVQSRVKPTSPSRAKGPGGRCQIEDF